MFQAFDDIGFGAYGEPEVLKNIEEVIPAQAVSNLKLGVHLHTWVDFLKETGWKGPN